MREIIASCKGVKIGSIKANTRRWQVEASR